MYIALTSKWPAQDIFFWVRSNVIVVVKGKMFGITPDRHTWMLELSHEPFVNVFSMNVEYCAVAGPLRYDQ
jgi:hypothetical protein